MKRYLKSLLLFLLPLVVVAISMEVLLRNIPNDYRYKKIFLDNNARSLEVLVLGNSHSFFDIDPRYIKQKCFNAAYYSQSLDYDLALLKKYDNQWDSLKYIVIPVDYFLLFKAPAYKTYVQYLDDRQWKSTISSITKLVANHPACRYNNFLTDTSFTSSDFADADHLNETGARKFSLQIDSLLAIMKK